jgi:glycosyltransferase involved in cell wall biosynthesis
VDLFSEGKSMATCEDKAPYQSSKAHQANEKVVTISVPPMTPGQRWSLRLGLLKCSIREYLVFDSILFKKAFGLLRLLLGSLLYICGRRQKGFAILAQVHRSALSEWGDRQVERLVRSACQAIEGGADHPLLHVYADHIRHISPTPQTAKFFEDPVKLLKGGMIVLKSSGPNEKGVLFLYYSYLYPLFAKLFDVKTIAEKYHLVLEPSWSGFCDLTVLPFTRLKQPVFVGSIEPRDTQFIQSLGSNLVPVSFSSNTWVDHRVFRPLSGVVKDLDIVMVAGWSEYKRHWAFFSALRRLCKQGVKPKVALIGYRIDKSQEDICRQAQLFGVSDLLEFYELLSAEEVNIMLNRAKVNVLWSRREGVNRTIIEGMFAGVPCIVREGMNYGYNYPHINARTGRFSTEGRLPQDLLEMIEHYQGYSPRDWVMQNMSCQRSTALLNQAIMSKALQLGEVWTRDLVVKTNELTGLCHWNPEDRTQFGQDYEFLRSTVAKQS